MIKSLNSITVNVFIVSSSSWQRISNYDAKYETFKMFDILQSSTKIIWVPKFHPNQIYLWYLILLFVWVQQSRT